MNEKENLNDSSLRTPILVQQMSPYIRLLIKSWEKILWFNGVILIISILILFLFIKNYYDSTVEILPDYGVGGMLGSLSQLASVAGLNVGETPPTQIYQNLIVGEKVLEKVIYEKYRTNKFNNPVNLIEYNEIDLKKTDGKDPQYLQERDKFLQMLKIFKEKMLFIDFDRTTNILTITIRANERELSAKIANVLVVALDDYVRTKRKTNATEQRIYLEKRLNQVSDSLTYFEESLRKFQESNRVISLSPKLILEENRMNRNIQIKQTVLFELTKQLELIKLEEIKNSPIINLREDAGIPIEKAGPKRLILLILIMIFSIGLSGGYFIFQNKISFYAKSIRKTLRQDDFSE